MLLPFMNHVTSLSLSNHNISMNAFVDKLFICNKYIICGVYVHSEVKEDVSCWFLLNVENSNRIVSAIQDINKIITRINYT